ncbi:MAG: glycosyltransferase family 4 protein, partial [Actinomycetota bacterium]
GVPVVLEVNETVGVDRTRQGKKVALPALARWFERRILRSASGVAVVSGYLREYVREAGVPEERIHVTPNAIDPAQFDPERIDGGEVRARYGLEGKTVIGFAGSFTKWHGLDLLIRAAAELMAEFPEVHLLLVGDGARRQESEAMTAELGISERTVFTGKVPHAEMPRFMAAMDLGVMPASNVYGSPMKVFEYMAMGCPPVAPRFGPLEEAIADGETGLLFEPGSAASLQGRLRKLLADPEGRRAVGAAARRRVLSRHLWKHNAQAVVELARPAPRLRRVVRGSDSSPALGGVAQE